MSPKKKNKYSTRKLITLLTIDRHESQIGVVN